MRLEINKRYVFDVEKEKDGWFKVIVITPTNYVVRIRAVNIEGVKEILKKIIT